MIPVSAGVMQNQRRIAVIGHYEIHKSVIIKIGESGSTSGVRSLWANPSRHGHLYKLPGTYIAEQRIDLLVRRSRRRHFNLGINMTVRNKEIEPAIIVVIEKAAAKAQYMTGGDGDSRLIAYLIEIAFSVVVPHVIGRSLEIWNIQIQPAVVVVVTERNAHGGHESATCWIGHAAGHGYFLERAVVLIVIEIGLEAVIGDE